MLSRLSKRRQWLMLATLLAGLAALIVVQPFGPFKPIAEAGAAPAGTLRSFASAQGKVTVETLTTGLANPWSLAFLPDGAMLVTERPGRLRWVSDEGKLGGAIRGVPAVFAQGQGGLLDVVTAPDFAQSREIFLSYSEPRDGGNGTAVARDTLAVKEDGGALENLQVIFRQQPTIDSHLHFGSRLVFGADGTLFITLGERGTESESAPLADNHLGKVVRIHRDGRVPADNPFVQQAGARPELWSLGHRNPQGAALHPVSGQLWLTEHGPKGGDEVNAPKPGRNYGWPVITHGVNYSGLKVGDGLSEKAGYEQPLWHWTPSIAPSGLAFYTADRFPAWRGKLFAGSLKFGMLAMLTLDGETVVKEERLLEGLNQRIRDVRAGPDGALYLLTDQADGALLRVTLGSR